MNDQQTLRSPAAPVGGHQQADQQIAQHRIAFFSPDMELCASLQLLFQNEYTLFTTTDPEMLLFMANVLSPRIMIVDAPLTDIMAQRFDNMKRHHPNMRILLFNVSHGHTIAGVTFISNKCKELIDAIIYKPVDIAELKTMIRELLPKSPNLPDLNEEN